MLALTLLTTLLTSTAAYATQPCCTSCPAGLVKVFSVDRVFNQCGESCLKKSKFWEYKLFEPGLEIAETEHPCRTTPAKYTIEGNYSVYKETEVHGIKQFNVTVDMYVPSDKPNPPSAAVAKISVSDNKKCVCKEIVTVIKSVTKFGNYSSQQCIEFGDKMCNDFAVLSKKACDDIVNATIDVKDALIKGLIPPRAVCEKLKLC